MRIKPGFPLWLSAIDQYTPKHARRTLHLYQGQKNLARMPPDLAVSAPGRQVFP
jgi:hypothetical protein